MSYNHMWSLPDSNWAKSIYVSVDTSCNLFILNEWPDSSFFFPRTAICSSRRCRLSPRCKSRWWDRSKTTLPWDGKKKSLHLLEYWISWQKVQFGGCSHPKWLKAPWVHAISAWMALNVSAMLKWALKSTQSFVIAGGSTKFYMAWCQTYVSWR